MNVQEHALVTIFIHMKEQFYRSEFNFSAPKLPKVNINSRHRSLVHKDPTTIVVKTLILQRLSGERPLRKRARKSISNFEVKKNSVIAFGFTLRSSYAIWFFSLLVNEYLNKVPKFRTFFSGKQNPEEELNSIDFSLSQIYNFPHLDLDFQKWAEYFPRGLVVQLSFPFPFRSYTGAMIFYAHFGLPLL